MQPTALLEILTDMGPAAIAVSGGVDSMTLACVMARYVDGCHVFHAVSPAVPDRATARVRRHAEREGWRLDLIDAGEFGDDRYRGNPLNRCFYCKKNLYSTIASETALPVLSGANLDDLADYRPGLEAAAEHGVRHPFVEAGMGKDDIRATARRIGLGELADLPASPCLSSRIETGRRIDAGHLQLIDRVEMLLCSRLENVAVRCRLLSHGVRIEVDEDALNALPEKNLALLQEDVQGLLGPRFGGVTFSPYVRGSAFVGAKRDA